MAHYPSPPFFLFPSFFLIQLISLNIPHGCSSSLLPLPITPTDHDEVRHDVPAMFVFGDSILDNGNNLYIVDSEDAYIQFLPYGMDFPCGPTGRYTHGRNPSDILARLLGIPYFLPPVMDPLTKGIRTRYGVNYASGGSGVLNATKAIFLKRQVDYFFDRTLPDLGTQFGNGTSDLESFLAQSLFVFNTGGNDIGDCFSAKRSYCSSVQFLKRILMNFTDQIERLYCVGAKKFVLFGVQAIGCNPGARAVSDHGGDDQCVEIQNEAALEFNKLLLSAMDEYKNRFPGSMFVYVNTYNIIMDLVNHPHSYGFTVSNSSCCDLGEVYLCKQQGIVCSDRGVYVYWDGFHFTDAAYTILATKAFSSMLHTEVYPFNVEHLARSSLKAISDI